MQNIYIILLLTSLCATNGYGQKSESYIFIASPSSIGLRDAPLSDTIEYYGLFIKSLQYEQEEFEIRKIDTRTYFKGVGDVDYKKIGSDSLFLIFSGLKFYSNKVNGMIPFKRGYGYLFPGQSFLYGGLHLYCKGEAIENKDSTSLEVFSMIKNYRVGVKYKSKNKYRYEILKKTDLTRWMIGQYLGGISIRWIGDLNGDGEIDIWLSSSDHHECYQDKFFLGNKRDEKKYIEAVYSAEICGG